MTHVQKDTAVLLKEKGFDLPSRQFFSEERDRVSNTQENNPINWNKYQGEYSAPTLYEACIWLRETKGVHVAAELANLLCDDTFWVACFYNLNENKLLRRKVVRNDNGQFKYYEKHDEALEAGIVHALKHYVK